MVCEGRYITVARFYPDDEAVGVGRLVQAYLLVHALIEALLRLFLRVPEEKDVSFANLIQEYRSYLKEEHYPFPTFVMS